jgi:hypothetical protein
VWHVDHCIQLLIDNRHRHAVLSVFRMCAHARTAAAQPTDQCRIPRRHPWPSQVCRSWTRAYGCTPPPAVTRCGPTSANVSRFTIVPFLFSCVYTAGPDEHHPLVPYRVTCTRGCINCGACARCPGSEENNRSMRLTPPASRHVTKLAPPASLFCRVHVKRLQFSHSSTQHWSIHFGSTLAHLLI